MADTNTLRLRVAELERVLRVKEQELTALRQRQPVVDLQRDQTRQRYENWKQTYANLLVVENEDDDCSPHGTPACEACICSESSTDASTSSPASTFSISSAFPDVSGASPPGPAVSTSPTPLEPKEQPPSPHAHQCSSHTQREHASSASPSSRTTRPLPQAWQRRHALDQSTMSLPAHDEGHHSGPAVPDLRRQATLSALTSPVGRYRRYSSSDAQDRSTSTSSIASSGPLGWLQKAAPGFAGPANPDLHPLPESLSASQAALVPLPTPDPAASTSVSWVPRPPGRQNLPAQSLLFSLPMPSLMTGSMPSPLPAPSDYLGTSSSDEDRDGDDESVSDFRHSSGGRRRSTRDRHHGACSLQQVEEEPSPGERTGSGWQLKQMQASSAADAPAPSRPEEQLSPPPALAQNSPSADAGVIPQAASHRAALPEPQLQGPEPLQSNLAERQEQQSLESDLVKARQRVAGLELELAAMATNAEQAQHDAVDAVLNALVAEAAHGEQVQWLSSELLQAKTEGEAYQAIQAELARQLEQSAGALEQAQHRVQDREDEVARLVEKVTVVGGQLAQARAEAEEGRSQAACQSRQLAEAHWEVKRLRAQLQALDTEVQGLRAQMQEYDSRAAQQAAMLREGEVELQKAREEVREGLAQEVVLVRDLAAAREEVQRLAGELEGRGGELAQCTQQLQERAEAAEALNGRLQQQAERLAKQESELKGVREELCGAREEVEQQGKQATAQARAQAESNWEVQRLKAQLQGREGEVEGLKGAVRESEARGAECMKRLEACQAELSSVKALMEEKGASIPAACGGARLTDQGQVEEGDGAVQTGMSVQFLGGASQPVRMEQREGRMAALAGGQAEAQSQVEELRVQLQARDAEVMELTLRAQRQQAELTHLKGEWRSSTNDELTLSAQLQHQAQMLHELNWRLRVQQQRCTELEQQVAAAQEHSRKQQFIIRDLNLQLSGSSLEAMSPRADIAALMTAGAPLPSTVPWGLASPSPRVSNSYQLGHGSARLSARGSSASLAPLSAMVVGSAVLAQPAPTALAPSILASVQLAPHTNLLAPPQFHTPQGRTAGSYLRNSLHKSREWP